MFDYIKIIFWTIPLILILGLYVPDLKYANPLTYIFFSASLIYYAYEIGQRDFIMEEIKNV